MLWTFLDVSAAVDVPVISGLELFSSLLSLEKRVEPSVLPRVSQQCPASLGQYTE